MSTTARVSTSLCLSLLLYYMGNYGDSVVGTSLNWTHRNHQRIGVAVADSPNGPWQGSDKAIVAVSPDTNAPDALLATNPSVTQRPDGGELMIYKAVGLRRDPNDWMRIAGGSAANQISIPVNQGSPAGFYRLVYP